MSVQGFYAKRKSYLMRLKDKKYKIKPLVTHIVMIMVQKGKLELHNRKLRLQNAIKLDIPTVKNISSSSSTFSP